MDAALLLSRGMRPLRQLDRLSLLVAQVDGPSQLLLRRLELVLAQGSAIAPFIYTLF